ncbi:MAG: ATP-binding protein [Gammaproteobacteria bacterium]|nr:ATP-binding protein [Gammaproteobacteria bacterium]
MTSEKLLNRHIIGLLCLVLMLEALHFAVWVNFGDALSRAMILIHLGLFLIWQPVWRGDESISWLNSGLFILFTLAFVSWVNLWLIFIWIILLIGFLGGFIKHKTSDQIIYMITLAFLITELLINVTTRIFQISIDPIAYDLFFYGLFILPLAILFFIKRKSSVDRESVDLLRAISSALLISLVALGSLLNMYHTGTSYMDALIETILAISFSLILISWLLSPRLGFSGLSQVWSQSLLNIGTPFEQWLSKISSLNQEIFDPDEFLDAAMEELIRISWITGVNWKAGDKEGQHGKEDKYQVRITVNRLEVTLNTRLIVGGALYLHCNLLIKIIENLYTSKIKERKLNQQTHLKSIYEAGARITHDIKNLLQSLKTLTSIVEQKNSLTPEKQSLIRSQLPHLSHRLQLALDKLQSPDVVQHQMRDIVSWSAELNERLDTDNVIIRTNIDKNREIPADLFDSVIDNLIENIYNKKQLEPDITATIEIAADDENISVTVTDNGSAIPGNRASRLFSEAVDSENGLGIGIYQSSRQARASGFELALENNSDGNVTFCLSSSEDPESGQAA